MTSLWVLFITALGVSFSEPSMTSETVAACMPDDAPPLCSALSDDPRCRSTQGPHDLLSSSFDVRRDRPRAVRLPEPTHTALSRTFVARIGGPEDGALRRLDRPPRHF